MAQKITRIRNKAKKSTEPSSEQSNILGSMNQLIENFSLGTSSKYIENISYLSSIVPLDHTSQKYIISLVISMILLETVMESGNFKILIEHKNCVLNFQKFLTEYLSQTPKKKILIRKLDLSLKALVEKNHQLVQETFQHLPDPIKAKLRMLTKIHDQCKNTKFSWTLLALQNLSEYQIESSIFPVYTKRLHPFLPEAENNFHTLVLDLDETLIHRSGQDVLVRPGAQEFLEEMSQVCEVVIFTAAVQIYADFAMKKIDPEDKVKLRLYRQHVSYDQDGTFKDLERLGRPLDKMVIVDNLEPNFRHQPNNGICIKTWTGDSNDIELSLLSKELKSRFSQPITN